jgi:hypothetical protein
MEGGAVGHNIESGPPKDHPSQICFNLIQQFQRRRFKCALLQIKMNSNFICSYMAMSSLTFILGFSVRFFQPVLFRLGIL